MPNLYDIKLETGAKYLACSGEELKLKANDWCVIRKERVVDYGQVVTMLGEKPCPNIKTEELPKIDRKATVQDRSRANENQMRAKSARRTAAKLIEELNLPMKLLNSHYSFDGKLVTFQFSADGRVDFRELVKKLSQALHTRIELRQIGVRDETSLIGGLGVCGLQLCCSRFLREFTSINVRMAKEQDLSLNPNNISGICGRLKCCLKYEHLGYIELDKNMPRRGAVCECPEGRGKVIDRNLLTQEVTILIEDTDRTITCPKEETRVVYPDKYKLPSGSTPRESEDLFDGLDEEAAKLLKELDEN